MKKITPSILALDAIEDKINEYIDLLVRENKKYNLTRITDPVSIREKLFLDSILPVKEHLGDRLSGRWIDVGSGAGFPGMPIALCAPDVSMTLLESVRKKCAFLKLAVEHLNMQNVTIVKERAEAAGRNSHYRERYDVCLSRAVAKLPVALELTAPFVRPGGNVLLWLGKEDAEQLHSSTHALTELSLEYVRSFTCRTSEKNPDSVCVLLKKIARCPLRYPRHTGIPRKRPLNL